MLHAPSKISAFARIVLLAFHKCIFDIMLPQLPDFFYLFFPLGYHDKPSSVLIFILKIFETHGCKQKVASFARGFFPWPRIQQTFSFIFFRLTYSDKMPHPFQPLDFFVGSGKVEKNLYF